jgi:C1A family cysteine protease
MQRAVDYHNKRFFRGEVSFLRGICEFSDMTADEMNAVVNRFVRPGQKPPKDIDEDEEDEEFDDEELADDEDDLQDPEQLDEDQENATRRKRSPDNDDDGYLNYTADGFINPVLNQGLCGSCWSFSSAAAIEAHWFKKTGELVKLSEQQLIDCNRDDEGDGNFGCDGGNMAVAFEFIKGFGGVALGSDYPYESNDTFKCRQVEAAVTVLSHKLLDPGDEDVLKQALINHGPISIAVDAKLPSFQSYKSGVYYDPKCTIDVNHAVLLVGGFGE